MSDAAFKSIEWRSFTENPSALLADEWALLTAGGPGGWNTMTVAWGGFGYLWEMDVALIFVRPSRHTFGFIERSDGFTLSFLGPGGKRIHAICGSRSGKDVDKAAAAGIKPRAFGPAGAEGRVGFEEARLVLSCRKLYSQDLDPGRFLDPSVAPKHYPRGDFHRMYAGAIEGAWARA